MPKSDSNIGILGYGEIGKAIAKFYKGPKIKDLTRDDGFEGIEVLHVCIPWSDQFAQIAEKEINSIKPKLTIIHSTIAPGTTKKIIKSLPRSFKGFIVHSPVRGVHPHLYEGIRMFVKYIGAEDEQSGLAAQKHLRGLGIRTAVYIPAVTTELGKLFDTTYYGLCIAWHGEMAKMCKKFGADFKKAVTDFNETYNEGYTKLGKKNVVRPVLYPPKEGIKGHCIAPNAEILRTYFTSEAIDLILKYKPVKKLH